MRVGSGVLTLCGVLGLPSTPFPPGLSARAHDAHECLLSHVLLVFQPPPPPPPFALTPAGRGPRLVPLPHLVALLFSFFQDRHAIVDGDADAALAGDGVVAVEGEVKVRRQT